jgi:hemoglobin/transferrin/lactoferrin receptor protein
MTVSFRHIFLLLLMVMIIFAAHSQDRKRNLFRLDADDLSAEVSADEDKIQSASRTIKNVEEIPATVYIISRREILENGYITLVDALKSVPGIRVSQPGSAVEGETFLVRGLRGNYYCKILIDGIPVQPSVVGGMPISAQLPIRQAERIEITFGPSSSLYGADALAGVINIVTQQSDRPVTAHADIAIGSEGQEYLNVSIGGKAGRNRNVLSYTLFGSAFKRNDMRVKNDLAGVYDPSLYDTSYSFLTAPYYKGDSTVPELGRLPESSRLLGFSLKWRGLSFQFMTMDRKIHSSIGQRTDLYSYASTSNFWEETIRRYSLSYKYERRRFSSWTTLSFLNYRTDNQSSFGKITQVGSNGNVYKYAASDDLFLEQQFNILPLPELELTTGFSFTASGNLPLTNDLYGPFNTGEYHAYSVEGMSDTVFGPFGYNPVNFYNIGGFVQLYYSKGRFTVILGERYDYHSRYEGANNVRVAVLFDAGRDILVRGGFSQGFRAPSSYYTYSSLAWKDAGGIYYETLPNEQLKPERLFSPEVGVRWSPKDRFTLDASVYYHRLSDQFSRSIVFIDPETYPNPSNPNLLAQSYVNDENSRAELYGLQASLNVDDLVRAVSLSGELLISVSKGKEVLPNDLGTINSYRQWPGFLGQFNFSIRPAKVLYLYFRNTFATDWTRQYFPVSKEILDLLGYDTQTKGYYTLDVIARIAISRNFHAFFHLNNLFNANYGGIDAYGSENDLRYNPQQGRNFRFGLTFSLE